MTGSRPTLLFVSPVFLFPNDAGGKIRTTNILRGLKGGAFRIRLASPAADGQVARWAAEIDGVCDEFLPWRASASRPRWARALDLFRPLPVNVQADRTSPALQAVARATSAAGLDLVVFDFVHSSVLRPPTLRRKSVCFTHNVESEIFARHASRATDPARRWLWSSQHAKMARFERAALRSYDKVIAVSERDAQFFGNSYGVQSAEAIPTGVDLDFFAWQAPPEVDADHPPTVVFTGSMNWDANIAGVQFFLRQVWPLVLARLPAARFVVVGRDAPASLLAEGRKLSGVQFTGFVDDVRVHVHGAQAFVIPLLVGGGTRIKAFEAMAMGCPVVSTAIGIEGLDASADEHYIERDAPAGMADALCALLTSSAQRLALSKRARSLVESRFGHRVAAGVFEDICLRTLNGQPRGTSVQP